MVNGNSLEIIVYFVRQALDNYIGSYNKSKENYRMVFGIWKGKNIDSLLYQQKLRDEWSK